MNNATAVSDAFKVGANAWTSLPHQPRPIKAYGDIVLTNIAEMAFLAR